MSRYSPQVLAERLDPLAAVLEEISSGIEGHRQRRRQDTQDARLEDLFTRQFDEAGYRYGEAPEEQGRTLHFPGEPRLPDGLDFRTRPPERASPLDPASFGQDVGAQLTGGELGADVHAFGDLTGAARPRLGPPPAPGAFVPGHGFVGVSPGAPAERSVTLPPTGRFRQVREQHGTEGRDRGIYVDETATPQAERAAQRASDLELSSNLRTNETRVRGDEARSLEDLRQRGRDALRDKINAAGAANILLRGDVQSRNSAAHDRRVTDRGTTASGRPATAGQRENNAMKAADGVISASGGSYDDATDWLEHTDEGRAAAKAGLEKRHLYAALGKYISGTTSAAIRLQAGAGMYTPEESTRNVGTTRKLATDQARPAPKGPKAGARPDSAATGGTGSAKPPRGITKAQWDGLVARGYKPADLAKKYKITAAK